MPAPTRPHPTLVDILHNGGKVANVHGLPPAELHPLLETVVLEQMELLRSTSPPLNIVCAFVMTSRTPRRRTPSSGDLSAAHHDGLSVLLFSMICAIFHCTSAILLIAVGLDQLMFFSCSVNG